MGRVVELKGRNGEYIPSFVSIDKLTNEVVAMRAENAFIPREIKGVQLTEQEQNDLREGKKVFIEGMISNSGKEFDAHIQINAERRGVEFIFENDKLFNRQSLCGVELTKQQIEDLNMGKAIFVEGMECKDGEIFSSYVKLDEATGRPAYTRYNPDSPEGACEIYIPKETNGVKITAEERQQLREGKTIFLNDMVNRKGEEFSSFIKADLETGRLSYSRPPPRRLRAACRVQDTGKGMGRGTYPQAACRTSGRKGCSGRGDQGVRRQDHLTVCQGELQPWQAGLLQREPGPETRCVTA